ncbi:MAG: MFS transporter [Rickettsiales bacterium]
MKKVVASGMIGNGLEWYDYALYGQMAWIIAELFFPPGDESVRLLATFGIFAAGFIVRPVGAVLFGWIGDRYGRKSAMVIAVLMMAIPTGCIGLLPTYEMAGITAPILLTIIRLLQGLSLGGEFAGSITYIVEHAPPKRRGWAGSASLVSLILGFLLGSLVVNASIGVMGHEAFKSWGWRIPFLGGIIIGLVGFYIRRYCEESPAYEEAKQNNKLSKTPVREAFTKHPWEMLQGFALYMTVTMPFYLTAVYFISFSQNRLGVSVDNSLHFNISNMFAMLFAMPFSAWLSDHIGRKKVMMAAAIAMFFLTPLLFTQFEMGAPLLAIGLSQFIFALLVGIYSGPVPAMLVEMFPTNIRFTGMAIAYNLSAAVFGGTAPMVCEWLIRTTDSNYSLGWYVMVCNICSLIALYCYKDRFNQPLR